MAANDAQLLQRMKSSDAQQLQPVTGKCSVMFHRIPGESFVLKHADPTSANPFTTHFKLTGRLWLSQQVVEANTGGQQMLKRTIMYEGSQIRSPLVDINPANEHSFRIRLEISGPPSDSFETNTLRDRLVNGMELNSEHFPINIESKTDEWKFLTLCTEQKGMLKHFTEANATALLHNKPTYHRSVDQEAWLYDQYHAMQAESDYAAEKLHKFKNVIAECVREMNFILIKIRFGPANVVEHIDDSIISNNLAQRYAIVGPTGSVLSPENVKDYVTRTGKATNFTGALVDYDTHADCVIQLRLLQQIPEHKLCRFHKQRVTSVDLFPLHHDQTLDEARLAHNKLNIKFDIEDAHELSNLFSSTPPATVMPAISMRQLFLIGERPLITRHFDNGKPLEGSKLRERETLLSWRCLDRFQRQAIQQSDEFPLSLIEGPPGTGKTFTVAAFLACRITSNTHDRIMVCAPRNVALRRLVEATVALWYSDGLQDKDNKVSPVPLVHVETEGIIDASYLCAKPPEGDYHLQNLRIKLAKSRQYLQFLKGVKLLEQDGYIADPKTWRRYKDARDDLTERIMQNARMIFVTTSSARGTFLRALRFLPNILVIDECGCAKPQDIAIPMMAMANALSRTVLAGDSRQLPPLIFTKKAQSIWLKSIFSQLITRGHITTRLNIEYRSHSQLYAPTSQVFYEGTVHSFRDTTLGAPPLDDLVQSLPRCILHDDTSVFRLSGYTHFLDVQMGKCVFAPGGSSQNELEARVAIFLVRGLIAFVPTLTQKHFMILSGYARQVKLIQSLARDCGLYDVPVKTVDGSQGAEAHITILSIVRDGGDLGFMQSAPRVNVATSRQRTALYIIGNWAVASSIDRKHEGNTNYLGRYLQNARAKWPAYIVRPEEI